MASHSQSEQRSGWLQATVRRAYPAAGSGDAAASEAAFSCPNCENACYARIAYCPYCRTPDPGQAASELAVDVPSDNPDTAGDRVGSPQASTTPGADADASGAADGPAADRNDVVSPRRADPDVDASGGRDVEDPDTAFPTTTTGPWSSTGKARQRNRIASAGQKGQVSRAPTGPPKRPAAKRSRKKPFFLGLFLVIFVAGLVYAKQNPAEVQELVNQLTGSQERVGGGGNGKFFVTATVLNVRETPDESTDRNKVGLLEYGDRVSVRGWRDDWARIGRGRWVYGAYLVPPDQIDRGPTFPCRGDLSSLEEMICNEAKLARLDWQMTQAYVQARRRASEWREERIKSAQIAWLDERGKCRTRNDPVDCLERVYRRRLQALTR